MRRVGTRSLRGCGTVMVWFCVGGMGIAMLFGSLVGVPTAWSVEPATAKTVRVATLALPLTFQPNHGQFDRKVQFLSRLPGVSVLLASTESILVLGQQNSPRPLLLRMRFLGADPSPEITGLDVVSGVHHYLIGRDPARWIGDIPRYAKVRYGGVYPGIHVVYYGTGGQLAYDVIVEPGADPHDVVLGIDGVEAMTIDRTGDLVLSVDDMRLIYRRPVIYQQSTDSVVGAIRTRVPIEGGYRITSDGNVGFRVGAFDRTKPVVIDPVLVYSTYLGGIGVDRGSGVGVDGSGNVFVAGTTNGRFPIQDSLQSADAGVQDVFVAKLSPQGDALIYSTIVGGHDIDVANDLAVDDDGHVYVIGSTFSEDFPVTDSSFQTTLDSGVDAFVFKLNPDGNMLVYSSFLGGDDSDLGIGIAVNALGEAFVTGRTNSGDFPIGNDAVRQQSSGGSDAFVTRLDAGGTAIISSTYLGGRGDDQGGAIIVDSLGRATVTGMTRSDDFPVTSEGMQTDFGGRSDGFVTRLSADGMQIEYSTYLGGEGNDEGRDIVVDTTGSVYVVGGTHSSDFPITDGVLQPTFGSFRSGAVNGDAFVSRLDSAGGALIFSTYVGGQGDDTGHGIAVDDTGHAYIVGRTTSNDFPIVNAVQADKRGGLFDGDMFATKMTPEGSGLVYSTYLGGRRDEIGTAIVVDGDGNAYITGSTRSADFPTADALQAVFGRESDVVLLKMAEAEPSSTPDLVAEITKFTHKIKASGDQLVVRLDIRNRGGSVGVVPFFVSLLVSDDAVLDDTDRPARQSLRVDLVETGKQRFKVQGLEPLEGKFAVILVDDGDMVPEGDEGNNMLIRAIGEG